MTRIAPTRTSLQRRIAADPTSTALLLAGPAALELIPGVRHVGAAGSHALVETAWPAATAATVRATPPQRTPTSFVSRFGFRGPGLPETEGTLVLSYADGPATQAELRLVVVPGHADAVDLPAVQELAAGFLANLAAAAEQRNRAA